VDFIRGFELTRVEGSFSAVKATFNHYNDFASFLVAMLLITCAVFGRAKKLMLGFILAVLSLLMVTNLILTHSRAGWLSLFLGFTLLVIFFPNRNRKTIFISFLVFSALGLASLPFTKELLISFMKRADGGRFQIWQAGFMMFRQSPLIGRGLGLFMHHLPQYGLEPLYAHNCYLQILAESGLLGLFSFLWFLGEIISRGFKKIARNSDILFLGLFSAFSAFLIHIFFDTQLYSLKLSMLFWLLASFVAVYLSCGKGEQESSVI